MAAASMAVVLAGRSVDAEEAGNVDWNAVESWGSNSSAGSAFAEIPVGTSVVVGANCLDVCTSGIGNGGFANPSE